MSTVNILMQRRMNDMMRPLLFWMCLLFPSVSSGQIQLQLYFENQCNDSIHQLEYGLLDVSNSSEYIYSKNGIIRLDSIGTYLLDATYHWGDAMRASIFHALEITNNKVDTLAIPRIKFTSFGGIHSGDWSYYNCEQLCDGLEREYYKSGELKIEGSFNKGRPKYIYWFREDGTKETFEYYIPGRLEYQKIEHYSAVGELENYELYKNGKKRTIITLYSADGTRIGRKVTKHMIERWK